jgi:hypothetical protein
MVTPPADIPELEAILADPAGYYVEVQTVSDGAIRGQLAADAPDELYRFTANLAVAGGLLDGRGDHDGSGTARITLADHGSWIAICGKLKVVNLAPVRGWYLYRRGEGQEVAVWWFPGNSSAGCSMPPPAALPQMDFIIADPSDFYAEVTTIEFPFGAIRGQLAADAPDTAMVPPNSSPWVTLGLLLVALASLLAVRRAQRLRRN